MSQADDNPNNPTDHHAESQAPRARRSRLRVVLLLILPLLAVSLGILLFFDGGRYVSTENAYVKAHKIAISSDLDGRVVAVEVTENQWVEQGQTLFRLDQAPLQIQLASTQAQIAMVQTDIEALRATYRQEQAEFRLAEERLAYVTREHQRQQKLSRNGIVSASAYEQTEQEMRAARQQLLALQESMNQIRARLGGDVNSAIEQHPRYQQAQAALQQVELDLRRTLIQAPTRGKISRLSLEPGEYVDAGQPTFSLIKANTLWIDANFKETQLTYIAHGQVATVKADTFPGLVWRAKVSSISAATGAEFALLPPQNASGNWVKVVQRIPVRLELLDAYPAAELRAGMSVQVEIDTGQREVWPEPLAELRRNLLGWLGFNPAAEG
jgi:membrane fusion protein (multidrug efflux system)